MADPNWRRDPHIMAARELCKRFGSKAVIVLEIEDGRYRVSSYGANRQLCVAAGRVGDSLSEMASDGRLDLSEVSDGE